MKTIKTFIKKIDSVDIVLLTAIGLYGTLLFATLLNLIK
jgi:hypothetical protein